MNKRVGTIAIMIEKKDSVQKINTLLSEQGEIIIGRLGVPFRERGVSIISIIIEATTDQVSSLTGKLGMFPGVKTKSMLLTK